MNLWKCSISFYFKQVLGLDQFTTTHQDLGHLNQIHRDLLLANLTLVWKIYPNLRFVPVYVFVEANLSQDLADYVQMNVKKSLPNVKFVEHHDTQGRLLPGVLTNHKANLVSYFKRVLDEEKLYFASQISSVSESLRAQLNQCQVPLPRQEEAKKMISEAISQLKAFKCTRKGKTTVFSGKSKGKTDDMVMALVIAVSWARLPSNMYTTK